MNEPLCESDARELLERWVRTTSMRRRGLAAKLEIVSFTSPGAHRVTFQSFTETRAVVPAHVPYRSGEVDGPQNGPVPDPWSIAAPMPPLFTDLDQHFEMPHTAHVESCHRCHGSGRVSCGDCGGDGRVTCGSCSGSGTQTQTRTRTTTDSNGQTHTETESFQETCWRCTGSGRLTCSTCDGTGRVTCSLCTGAGRLRHFQRLDVTWSNVVRVEVLEGTELPDDLLLDAEGRVALLEEDPVVERTAGLAGAGAFRGGLVRVNADVDRIANELIEKHHFPGGTKIHRQRLTVHAVPVYRAEYRWGRHTKCFFIYGKDRIHAPGYPISIIRATTLAGALTVVAATTVMFVARDRERVAHQYDADSVTDIAPVPSQASMIPYSAYDTSIVDASRDVNTPSGDAFNADVTSADAPQRSAAPTARRSRSRGRTR